MDDIIYVIIPAYNEELMIEKAYSSIDSILTHEEIKHKIVFVDDGSLDKTWNKIKDISLKNDKNYINL